jgi:hypothetical protein
MQKNSQPKHLRRNKREVPHGGKSWDENRLCFKPCQRLCDASVSDCFDTKGDV